MQQPELGRNLEEIPVLEAKRPCDPHTGLLGLGYTTFSSTGVGRLWGGCSCLHTQENSENRKGTCPVLFPHPFIPPRGGERLTTHTSRLKLNSLGKAQQVRLCTRTCLPKRCSGRSAKDHNHLWCGDASPKFSPGHSRARESSRLCSNTIGLFSERWYFNFSSLSSPHFLFWWKVFSI